MDISLCSVTDVTGLDELNILADVPDDDVATKIRVISMKMLAMVGSDLTGNLNAKYACAYGVLTQFQSGNSVNVKVQGTQQVTSIKEGDKQVNYSSTSSTSTSNSTPSSYEDWYWFFMNRLVPTTPNSCPVYGTDDPDWK